MTFFNGLVEGLNKVVAELPNVLVHALGGATAEEFDITDEAFQAAARELQKAVALEQFATAIGILEVKAKHTRIEGTEGEDGRADWAVEFVVDWDEAKAVAMFESMGIQIKFPEQQLDNEVENPDPFTGNGKNGVVDEAPKKSNNHGPFSDRPELADEDGLPDDEPPTIGML